MPSLPLGSRACEQCQPGSRGVADRAERTGSSSRRRACLNKGLASASRCMRGVEQWSRCLSRRRACLNKSLASLSQLHDGKVGIHAPWCILFVFCGRTQDYIRRIRVVHVYPDCILKSVMYPEVRGRIHAFSCILPYSVCIPMYSGKGTGYDQNTQNTVYPNVSRPKYGGPSRIRSEY